MAKRIKSVVKLTLEFLSEKEYTEEQLQHRCTLIKNQVTNYEEVATTKLVEFSQRKANDNDQL